MAATYGTGGCSPPVIGRPIERVFEEAQTTGEINLSGRKLKEYPKICQKYDLADTIIADLSKNRLTEFPQEICEYSSMERINCYHNCIKSIPESIIHLQQLTHLNLSRNQLTVLPAYIGGLVSLEVLIAANNKLVSLPEEIGMLEKLMELDVSCNEISHLPPHLGELSSLRSLNVRRNFLVELPLELSRLTLRKIDFSNNRIEKIPTVFRKIDTLEEIILDNNPLILPTAHICTKGRQHIMKYLQMEAIKENRKRGVLESEMKRMARKSLPPQQTSDEFRNMVDSPDARWKRHTVLSSDSGYSTTDSLEKCGWSPSEVPNDVEAANSLAIKAAEAVREHRQDHRRFTNDNHKVMNENHDAHDAHLPHPHPSLLPHPIIQPHPHAPPHPNVQPHSHPHPHHAPHPLSPLQEPPSSISSQISTDGGEDAFTRELQRQKSDYDRKRKRAEQIRIQQEEEEKEERRRAAIKLQEEQQRLLHEKQREEQRHKEEARLQEEARMRDEENRRREEAQRREEEIRRQEEEARRLDDQRKQEEIRRQQEEAKQKEEQKSADLKKQRIESKKQIQIQSSNSFKEDRKISNNTQYRRTSSDSVKKATSNHVNNSHVDNNNYINRNGVGSQDSINSNSSSTNQGLNPNTHHSTTPSPASSNPSIARLHAGEKKSTPTGSPVVRRAKVGDKTSTIARPSGRMTPSSTTPRSQTSTPTTRRNNLTPQAKTKTQSKGIPTKTQPKEEEFKKKHQALQNKHIHESQTLRKRLEDTRTTTQKRSGGTTNSHPTTPTSGPGRNRTGLSAGTMKLLEEYKDSNPNFTIRRHHEQQREEIEHLDQLRQTIESRLKVTLPDNLPDALRDGVVLCHLANQIRPRSVASIHVPSPAVPKLTMAKCRRNVENFLEACRKIGVSQDQICSVHDILEEKSVIRVSVTAIALVNKGTNPKTSVV